MARPGTSNLKQRTGGWFIYPLSTRGATPYSQRGRVVHRAPRYSHRRGGAEGGAGCVPGASPLFLYPTLHNSRSAPSGWAHRPGGPPRLVLLRPPAAGGRAGYRAAGGGGSRPQGSAGPRGPGPASAASSALIARACLMGRPPAPPAAAADSCR